jgi:hypothetical protein
MQFLEYNTLLYVKQRYPYIQENTSKYGKGGRG